MTKYHSILIPRFNNKTRILGRVLRIKQIIGITKRPIEIIQFLLLGKINRLGILYLHYLIIHHPKTSEITELDHIFSQEAYGMEPNLYNFNISDMQIVDIGSNIGLSVLFFSSRYPSAKISAYEPNPVSYHYLLKNLSFNTFNNSGLITCYRNAIVAFRQKTFIDFYINISRSVASSLYKNMINVPREKIKRIRVPTDDLTNIILKHKQIDILKIDAEGVEYSLISTIVKYSHRIKNVFIEFHLEASPFPFKAIDQLNKTYNLSVTCSPAQNALVIHGIQKDHPIPIKQSDK